MGVKLTKGDIKKTKGKFIPKVLISVIDELGELMSSDDFRAVSNIKSNMGSIGRLGRAAGCHMVLATQKASSGTISSELMNNIHQRAVLGDFDGGVSSTLFEKDISHMSRPEIKGRGFMKSGSQLYEFQSYWTDPKTDFVFEDVMFIDRLQEYRDKNPIKEDIKEENKENEVPKELENRRERSGKSYRPGMFKEKEEKGYSGPVVANTSDRIPTRDFPIPPKNEQSSVGENQLKQDKNTIVERKNPTKENIVPISRENKKIKITRRKDKSLDEENPLHSRQRRAETIAKLEKLEIEEGVEYKT